MLNITNFIVGLFPSFYFDNDTYKDGANKGLLRRYVEIFGDELDAGFVNYVTDLSKIIDIRLTPEKYLNLLGEFLGRPVSPTSTTAQFREFLTMVTNIYKTKGSIESYRRLFFWLGVDINIVETYPETTLWDDDHTWDSDMVYDYRSCEQCTNYDIHYLPNDGTCLDGTPIDLGDYLTNISQETMQQIICMLEPIDAKLGGLYGAIKVCDTVVAPTETSVVAVVLNIPLWDTGEEWDDVPIDYDDSTVDQTVVFI